MYTVYKDYVPSVSRKLILQVGKAHNLHSTVLLVYRHSLLSRKRSNQCSMRQSRQIPNSIPVVWKIQLRT